jgi:hypothetical protein
MFRGVCLILALLETPHREISALCFRLRLRTLRRILRYTSEHKDLPESSFATFVEGKQW